MKPANKLLSDTLTTFVTQFDYAQERRAFHRNQAASLKSANWWLKLALMPVAIGGTLVKSTYDYVTGTEDRRVYDQIIRGSARMDAAIDETERLTAAYETWQNLEYHTDMSPEVKAAAVAVQTRAREILQPTKKKEAKLEAEELFILDPFHTRKHKRKRRKPPPDASAVVPLPAVASEPIPSVVPLPEVASEPIPSVVPLPEVAPEPIPSVVPLPDVINETIDTVRDDAIGAAETIAGDIKTGLEIGGIGLGAGIGAAKLLYNVTSDVAGLLKNNSNTKTMRTKAFSRILNQFTDLYARNPDQAIEILRSKTTASTYKELISAAIGDGDGTLSQEQMKLLRDSSHNTHVATATKHRWPTAKKRQREEMPAIEPTKTAEEMFPLETHPTSPVLDDRGIPFREPGEQVKWNDSRTARQVDADPTPDDPDDADLEVYDPDEKAREEADRTDAEADDNRREKSKRDIAYRDFLRKFQADHKKQDETTEALKNDSLTPEPVIPNADVYGVQQTTDVGSLIGGSLTEGIVHAGVWAGSAYAQSLMARGDPASVALGVALSAGSLTVDAINRIYGQSYTRNASTRMGGRMASDVIDSWSHGPILAATRGLNALSQNNAERSSQSVVDAFGQAGHNSAIGEAASSQMAEQQQAYQSWIQHHAPFAI
jgi:hypothetical protein